jgi:hypothetical protein
MYNVLNLGREGVELVNLGYQVHTYDRRTHRSTIVANGPHKKKSCDPENSIQSTIVANLLELKKSRTRSN